VFVGVVRQYKLDMGKYVWFYSCSGQERQSTMSTL